MSALAVAVAIELRGASRLYGTQVALYPADLVLEQGKTTVLIGPSGCGKSTILRLIVGLIEPSAGTVFVEDERVTPESAQALRRRMGYVIQDGGLFPHLTAEQNVLLMARHLRMADPDIIARLDQLLMLTRFPREALTRYPAELSGGQRQRVSLMRALMLDPHVLLLDEPLGALDPMIRAGLQTDLKEIFSRLRKTVVLVTHDMAEAAFLADRIVLMRDGRVVQQGSLADLQERPAEPFVSEFLEAQRRV